LQLATASRARESGEEAVASMRGDVRQEPERRDEEAEAAER